MEFGSVTSAGTEPDEEFQFTPADFKDLDMNSLKQLISTFMPIVWISDTNYLMGTHIKKVTMPKNHCMVSVGGGYMEISEYYYKESYG